MIWDTYNTTSIKEKYLFQFFSQEAYFTKTLATNQIHFKRAFDFGDKFECLNVKELLDTHFNRKKIWSRQKRHLISCWHLGNRESVSMWETHLTSRIAAIRFMFPYLKNLVKGNIHQLKSACPKDLFIAGKVRYKDLVTNTGNANGQKDLESKYVAFRKDTSFSYENEFRFVLNAKEEFTDGIGFYLGELSELKFDIILNPLMSTDKQESLRVKIREIGFENRVKESDLRILFKLFDK